MKTLKKLLTLCICAVLSVSALIGCGNNGGTGTPVVDDETGKLAGDLKVLVWDGGYGRKWLDNVVAAFTAKNPDVKIKVTASTDRQKVFSEIVSVSPKYDVIFSESLLSQYAEQYLEPLNDVYSYVNKGESVSVGDKINDVHKNFLNLRGNYYQVPSYVGAYGIVYNTELISDAEVPATSDELVALCDSVKLTSVKPFIFSGESGVNYLNFLYCTWFAQYEGRTTYTNALWGKTVDADGNEKFDPATAYLGGGLKAMQACEDIFWYPNGNIVEDSVGLQFITAQSDFLRGGAAMMYNGSWMLNEMYKLFPNGTDVAYKMMKVPVLSAIIEKCSSIENDAELSALVKAIDKGETALNGTGYEVTADDYATVKEARSFYYAGGEGATAVLPKNRTAKELAKRFLAFMYTDQGIAAHARAQAGCVLPVKDLSFIQDFSFDKNVEFYESSYSILLNSEVFFNNPIIGVTPYCSDSGRSIEKQFGSSNAKDRTTAIDSYNAKKAAYTANDNKKFWDDLMSAGIIKEIPND